MKLFILLLISMLISITLSDNCHISATPGEDRRTNKDELIIVQYNVEWLFISSSNCPGNDCLNHIKEIAKELVSLNADIYNLAEVENCEVLNLLIDEMYKLSPDIPTDTYEALLIKGTDTSTNQNVGLITKISPITPLERSENKISWPIVNNTCNYMGHESGTYGVSKHYSTRFKINNKDLYVFGVHFLAFPTDPLRCVKREAQAGVIADYMVEKIIEEDNQNLDDVYIVVLGDMNDYDGSINDANYDVPTSRALEFLREFDDLTVADQALSFNKNIDNSYQLHNIGELVSIQKNIFTSWWDRDENCNVDECNELTAIDHILVSPNLLSRTLNVEYVHNYPNYCGNLYSDHWPIKFSVSTSDSPNFFNNNNNNNDLNPVVSLSDPISDSSSSLSDPNYIIFHISFYNAILIVSTIICLMLGLFMIGLILGFKIKQRTTKTVTVTE
eukprot:TRINITY_DN427_c0_g1_i1.p1 TRINITY_DN427_c0_g1~~TRINITY_DN427_c0_g1_i1.p1  ORF type:complete len:445 (+),score=106.96 TRINITY_DN427_c0_g1_i1:84-1418(+)